MNIVNTNNSNRRKGESLLPHLVQEIQDKLLKGSIECMICYDMDPPSDLYLTPHSCGESCRRPLDKDHRVGNHDDDDRYDGCCRHRCVVQCHPGPCLPCKAFAPPRICPCGKKTIPTRCSDQKSLLACGQRCGKLLKCLRHCCSKTCHVGPCDMAVKGHANVENDGIFSCNSCCGKPLGCGNHVCKGT
ncbi:NF-X1-type zinc finger protein NFXL1, partial [Tanacetum coccineum]